MRNFYKFWIEKHTNFNIVNSIILELFIAEK